MLQQQAVPYKAAQFIGAALGVALGCLIGMTPLLFMASRGGGSLGQHVPCLLLGGAARLH